MHNLLSENKPDVEELFTLPEKDSHLHGDVRRIHYEVDLRQENSGIFTIWLEDHTVGHALRRILLKNPNVVFAGYRIPHPLEHKMIIRVQTRNKETPMGAMKLALRILFEQSQKISAVFDKALGDYIKNNPDDSCLVIILAEKMNTSGTIAQFNLGTNNGTTVALAGGQTGVLSPRNVMGTEALLSMRGWLLKRKKGVYDASKVKSITKLIGSDFNKRFFWIDSSIRLIYYSESEDNSKRVSFIPFSRLVSATQVTDPMAINTARPGWVYGIELRTTDRIYELWARTPSEARQWLAVMEKAASIGRTGGMSTTSYALAAGGGTTTHYLDSLGPLNGTSRRGSTNSGSSGAEQGNTIPVVNGPQVPQGSGDDVTVVAAIKENLDRTANAVDMVRSPVSKDPLHAPSKWDEWDR